MKHPIPVINGDSIYQNFYKFFFTKKFFYVTIPNEKRSVLFQLKGGLMCRNDESKFPEFLNSFFIFSLKKESIDILVGKKHVKKESNRGILDVKTFSRINGNPGIKNSLRLNLIEKFFEKNKRSESNINYSV